MGDFFIQLRPYQGLDLLECALMSWIVGLHKSNKPVCFTNKYAAFILKTTDRTIRTKVSSLMEKGLIETYQPFGDKRFIKIVSIPPLESFQDESCSVEGDNIGEEITSTEGGNDFHRGEENTSKREENISVGEETISTNIIDNKIVDKIVSERRHTHPLYPNQFMLLVDKYGEPENKLPFVYEQWKLLNENQKVLALDSVSLYFLYLENNPTTRRKPLEYFLKDRVFEWDALDKEKKKKQNNKQTKPQMTEEQRNLWVQREMEKYKQNGK
jgi:hypothetical protein